MSSTSPNRLNDGDIRQNPADNLPPQADSVDAGISVEEAAALRVEKLRAIRDAIAAGDYDTDELLDKAMAQMLKSVQQDDDTRSAGA